MQSSQVVIDAEIKTALQDLFPFKIMESDLPYIVDLFLTLGMATMKIALGARQDSCRLSHAATGCK